MMLSRRSFATRELFSRNSKTINRLTKINISILTFPYLYQYYRTIHIDPTHITSSDLCVGSPHLAICIVITPGMWPKCELSEKRGEAYWI
jgi:hypothetical protein